MHTKQYTVEPAAKLCFTVGILTDSRSPSLKTHDDGDVVISRSTDDTGINFPEIKQKNRLARLAQ